MGDNLCSKYANCTNIAGSYECTCTEGYDGNGITCYDVDECLDKDRCQHGQICVNEDGGHRCDPVNGIFDIYIDVCWVTFELFIQA